MNIYSKKLLMSGKKYKAFILHSGTYIDVADLGFTEKINPDKTFGASDETSDSSYIILNGKLYAVIYSNSQPYSLTRIGTRTDWTAISRNYGIAGGELYQINGTTASKISNYTDFKKVCGAEFGNGYAIGTSNNRLFSLSGSTASQPGNLSWADISGFNWYQSIQQARALGISSDGELYVSTSSAGTMSKIGTYNDWTAISGYLLSTYGYGYGIRSGSLYGIYYPSSGANINQIGTRNDWTAISGWSSNPNTSDKSYAYGIAGGELYGLRSAAASKLHHKNDWDIISQSSNNGSDITGYGIRNGVLYKFASNTVTIVGLSNCVKLMTSRFQGLVIVEEPVTIVSPIEQAWTRPNLTANGTLGGDSFAVDAPTFNANYPAYKAVDGNLSSNYGVQSSTAFAYTIYNPNPLKISQIGLNCYGSYYPIAVTLSGSIDGEHFYSIASSYHSNILTITNPTAYLYYKLALQPNSNINRVFINELNITATEVIEP